MFVIPGMVVLIHGEHSCYETIIVRILRLTIILENMVVMKHGKHGYLRLATILGNMVVMKSSGYLETTRP